MCNSFVYWGGFKTLKGSETSTLRLRVKVVNCSSNIESLQTAIQRNDFYIKIVVQTMRKVGFNGETLVVCDIPVVSMSSRHFCLFFKNKMRPSGRKLIFY